MKGTTPAAGRPPADVFAAYRAAGQDHVFRFWPTLGEAERAAFAAELRSVDLEAVTALASDKLRAAKVSPGERLPAEVLRIGAEPGLATLAGALAEGKRLLAAGKVGVFLVAGGQGSRLGFEGPKGCLPVGPLSGKSLFQVHAEKVLASSRPTGRRIPLYIMTSLANDAATRSFFAAHGHFGLHAGDVFFLPQKMLPALDDHGKLILEAPGKLFLSPNGHGGAYEAFRAGGCLDDAESRGLEHIFYFQVDNPLVRVAEPLYLGLHALGGAEMSLKVLRKTGPEEKIGVVAVERGRTVVVEYSDLSSEEANRLDARGELVYWAGSIAIHAFRFDFFRRLCDGGIRLPYHVARKQILSVDPSGKLATIEGSKFESFVFDALLYASRPLSVECRREEEFAPIKNSTGVDSLESARALMVAEHRRWLHAAGMEATGTVEVSPLAALDRGELREKLRGQGMGKVVHDVLVEEGQDGKVVLLERP